MKTKSKILATIALGLGIATPTLASAAAPANHTQAVEKAAKIELAGYYTYRPTCERVIVDYDFYGRPIWMRVCG